MHLNQRMYYLSLLSSCITNLKWLPVSHCSRINSKILRVLLITVVHNPTMFHENLLKPFRVILLTYTNTCTDGYWRKHNFLGRANQNKRLMSYDYPHFSHFRESQKSVSTSVVLGYDWSWKTTTSSSTMAERPRELGDFKGVGHFEAKL